MKARLSARRAAWRAARRAARPLRWAIGLATLAVVISSVDLTSLASRLRGVDVPLVAMALAGLVAVHVLGALSWRRLTARLAGVRLGWGRALRLYYGAQAVGALTPANLGSDVYRIAALDASLGRRRIAVPIVAQRVTSVAALVALGAAGALAVPIAGFAWLGVVLLGAVAGLLAALGPLRRNAPVRSRLDDLARKTGLDPTILASGAIRSSVVRDGFGLGLLFHASAVLLGLLLVAAVDPGSAGRPMPVLAAVAVARLSLAVPLSPSGIGIQEGVLAALFGQLGLSPETAVAATLINRLALLVTAAIGSVAILGDPGAGAADAVHARPAGSMAADQADTERTSTVLSKDVRIA